MFFTTAGLLVGPVLGLLDLEVHGEQRSSSHERYRRGLQGHRGEVDEATRHLVATRAAGALFGPD